MSDFSAAMLKVPWCKQLPLSVDITAVYLFLNVCSVQTAPVSKDRVVFAQAGRFCKGRKEAVSRKGIRLWGGSSSGASVVETVFNEFYKTE